MSVLGSNPTIKVMGHGPMGYTLYDKFTKYGFQVQHISHDHDNIEDSILFLCIPSNHILTAINNLQDPGSTIVVDCSSQSCRHESICNIRYVKALGDTSVSDILNETTSLSLVAATNDDDAKDISDLLRSINIENKVIPLPLGGSLDMIDDKVNRVFPGWGMAIVVCACIWGLNFIYASIRYLDIICCGHTSIDKLGVFIINKVHSWSGLWCLTLPLLVGGIAKVWRCSGELPKWLVNMLYIRKQIGLLGGMLILQHVIMSTLILSPAYYSKFYKDDNTLLPSAEWSFFFATLGFTILVPIVVTSLTTGYTQKEWRMCQYTLSVLMLSFSTVHVFLTSYLSWDKIGDSSVHKGIPSITFVSVIPVVFVLLFRVLTDYICPYSLLRVNTVWYRPSGW